ncbi:hypothetical protein ACFYUY_06480 [Kitasatospora sp. NPDC004745]|uniref:hypothetical protein n=1 Tax=Kitasatospora sp. NPDC004745 TaxID=3364019 RepID=UPI0036BF9506
MRRHAYAPANTLPGLLQRGRGLGALMAAEDPSSAAELVHGCIRWEWRWDTTVDERHRYLARLVRDLDLPLRPVVDLLSADEDARERATRVLELLALSGSAEAREALRSHVADGEHWLAVLESVADRWPAEWWDDLADTARARLARGGEPTPWAKVWARWGIEVPTAARGPERPDPLTGLSGAALLELLADPAEPDAKKTDTLAVLHGRDPEPALVPLVPALGTADGEFPLPLLPTIVEKLGPRAMPAARDWAVSGTPWLARLGHEVLARHGEEQDAPALVADLERDWVERTWCGPMHTARGLARLGPAAADAVSLLRRFWLQTPHSYERPAYLAALAAISPAGTAEAYTESLWDCERDARLLGVAHALDRPHVRERLAALRDDPMEATEVANAAGARLAGLTSEASDRE